MKSILTKKVLFLALVAVTVFATGCIKEDLDECYKLTLKVVNHKGDDITALSVVSEAKLFIYDNNSKLLDTRDLNDAFIRGKETIELNVLCSRPAACPADILRYDHRIRMRCIYDQRDLLLLDLLLHLCFVQSSGVDMKILSFF